MFPTGKQLPQLTSLVMHDIWQTSWDTQALAAPFGFQLVSCCPGLQHLDMRGLSKSAGTSMLTALQRLSDLRTLLISPAQGTERGGLVEVCKMTGLRQLDLYKGSATRAAAGSYTTAAAHPIALRRAKAGHGV
jgi:hypothetical protein